MENINIPNFYNKEIKEYILCLFNEYNTTDKNKYENIREWESDNTDYFTDKLMKFILESLNIKLEDFEYLFRKYVDSEQDGFEYNDDGEGNDDGTMFIYNFSKIISLSLIHI